MKNVIVTGANGFIGSSLIKKLVANKVKVVAVDITFAGNHLPATDLITKVESGVDVTLTEKIPRENYDAFYHLAWRGVNGADKANPTIQLANIQMAVDCANVCKQLNVKKLLIAGTVAENATFSLQNLSQTSGGMMYGVAKHACHLILEDYCKNIGQKFVWMQFSNIYGVGNKTGNLVSYTLGELMAGKEATFGPALQPYDFIYVEDLIEAVYRLGTKETNKSFYYIGSGTPCLLKEYLLRIGELAGCEDMVHIGVRPDDGIKYTKDMFDNSNLVDAIGNYNKTNFDKGIMNTIAWLSDMKRGGNS
jgi:nucleoside-diphosphate-sugar epimerase